MKGLRTVLLVICVLSTLSVFSFNVNYSNINGVEESRTTIGLPISPAFTKVKRQDYEMSHFNLISWTTAAAVVAIASYAAYVRLGTKSQGRA